jgi:hypothetical protein
VIGLMMRAEPSLGLRNQFGFVLEMTRHHLSQAGKIKRKLQRLATDGSEPVPSDLRELKIDHWVAEQKPAINERFYHDLPVLLRLRLRQVRAAFGWWGLDISRHLAAAGSRPIIEYANEYERANSQNA